MMTLAQMKKLFFDTRKVTDPAERAKWSVLGRFGGRTRLRARQSMKRAPLVNTKTGQVYGRGRRPAGVATHEGSAPPGSPPYTHGNPLLKQMLFYGIDRSGEGSVVAGPTLLNGGDGLAPRLLEHGGDAVRRRVTKKFRTRGGRVVVEFDATTVRQHYRGNAFMQPAFDAELPGAVRMFEGAIK